jgi:hypothetical protein
VTCDHRLITTTKKRGFLVQTTHWRRAFPIGLAAALAVAAALSPASAAHAVDSTTHSQIFAGRVVTAAGHPVMGMTVRVYVMPGMAQSGIASAAAAQRLPRSCQKYDAKASTYQRAQVAAAIANNPAGICTGVGKISWNKGSVIMTIPKTANAPAPALSKRCPTGGDLDTGWACVFNATHFKGTKLQFHDCCYEQNLRHYGGADWVSLSYVSTRRTEPPFVHPYRSWLYQFKGKHHGLEYCMEGESAAGVISGNVKKDQWIFLSNSTDHC